MIKKLLKKWLLIFSSLFVVVACLFGVACQSSSSQNNTEKPTFVLNQPVLELSISETFTLCVLSSTDSAVTAEFSSAMPQIASVDEHGKVTANKVGETKITATVSGQTIFCIVRVSVKLQAVPELVLQGMKKTGEDYSLTLIKGTEYSVNPVLYADGKSLSVQITAMSDNAQSVKIENNIIKAEAVAENVKITFRCTYENETFETVCYVNVEEVTQ